MPFKTIILITYIFIIVFLVCSAIGFMYSIAYPEAGMDLAIDQMNNDATLADSAAYNGSQNMIFATSLAIAIFAIINIIYTIYKMYKGRK